MFQVMETPRKIYDSITELKKSLEKYSIEPDSKKTIIEHLEIAETEIYFCNEILNDVNEKELENLTITN
jgi:hypothetical protein